MSLLSGIPDITAITKGIGDVMTTINGPSGLIAKLSLLVGGFFVIQAMMRAKNMASPHHGGGQNGTSVVGVMSSLFWGIVLINFWEGQQQVADQLSLTGGVLNPSFPDGRLNEIWTALKVILNGFGVITFFRGLLVAKAAGDGTANGHKSPAWGALWHIVGGVLLMKI